MYGLDMLNVYDLKSCCVGGGGGGIITSADYHVKRNHIQSGKASNQKAI